MYRISSQLTGVTMRSCGQLFRLQYPTLFVFNWSHRLCCTLYEISDRYAIYRPPPNAWYLTLHFQGRTHKLVEGCLYFPSILPFPSILLLSPSFPFSSSPCPTPFLLFRSPPLPLEVGPLKPSGGLGSAVSSPRPQTNWMHSRSVRKPPVAIILSILKCMFYSRSIKIWHKLS